MNICRGSSPSRRDDIESILYIIVNCVVDEKLPWAKFGKYYNEHNLSKLRFARSTPEAVEEVRALMPESFKAYYSQLCELKYEDKPDYDSLRLCIRIELSRMYELHDETA